jgi:hypothetical protein
LIDTALFGAKQNWFTGGKAYDLKGRSMAVFRTVAPANGTALQEQRPRRRASATVREAQADQGNDRQPAINSSPAAER